FVIFATGCLSVPFTPPIAGLADFSGSTYTTGHWPHEPVDFSGQKVAVIGTGSSAIQSIPLIAKEAAEVTVFQRTANYSVPARNAMASSEISSETKESYQALRELAKTTPSGILTYPNPVSALEVSDQERMAAYEKRWENGGLAFLAAFSDIMTDQKANDTASDFFKNKIRSIVRDTETAEALCPTFPLGGKRMCVDTEFYETFNRDNVSLVNLKKEPIESIDGNILYTTSRSFEFDTIVLATGFDAMTGALNAVDIRGKENLSLKQTWSEGPDNYLGLMVNGFPNLFTVTGPGSPSVFTNMLMAIEQHVDWITDCLEHMAANDLTRIEAQPKAQLEWGTEVQRAANQFLRSDTDSWYTGANIEGKKNVFMPYMGGLPAYRDTCDEVASDSYRGFKLA
ncbi:NAD(P)/FAD-dependent oxidoreductase, partial [Alphaproteobacteria bacterium]|nr:NAD(P)/FAD-dependent oxidoreductase [Alphaproteobacteria bacterium]